MTLPRWIAFVGFLQAALLLAVVDLAHGFALGEDSLGKQLNELDRLRRGPKTPFEEVERRSKQLLQEHVAREAQGRIYSRLAHIYAQSGMSNERNARAARRYAEKAVEYPLDPETLLQTYVYWGDGEQVSDRSEPFPERRRRAAKAYLRGLKAALDCGAPLDRPELPPLPEMPGLRLYGSGSGPADLLRDSDEPETNGMMNNSMGVMLSAEEGKRFEEALAAYAVEQAEVRRMQPLWRHRRDLFNQLIDMYGRRTPHAASELRRFATEIVGDQQVVAALMERLEERGALKDDPLPKTVKARRTQN